MLQTVLLPIDLCNKFREHCAVRINRIQAKNACSYRYHRLSREKRLATLGIDISKLRCCQLE